MFIFRMDVVKDPCCSAISLIIPDIDNCKFHEYKFSKVKFRVKSMHKIIFV